MRLGWVFGKRDFKKIGLVNFGYMVGIKKMYWLINCCGFLIKRVIGFIVIIVYGDIDV